MAGALALAAGVVGGTGAIGALAPFGVPEAGAATESIISVTQRPSTIDLGPCRPGIAGLTYETIDRQDSFTLRIVAATEPCSPLAAVAAAYRMPDGFAAWPQTLAERKDLLIDAAGVTEVRFAKGCLPLQFDVVTGATPDTIAPWAQWHGPLLFPGDVRTALQHRPSATCVPVTTSTSTSTSTTTPNSATTVATTTTSPTSTSSTSTTFSTGGQGSTTSTSQLPSVLSAAETPPSDAPAAIDTSAGRSGGPQVAGLALTGAPVRVLIAGGLFAILVGVAMLATQRRRQTS